MNVTLQLLFTIVLLWAGKNSGVETWNLRCFETSDLDFETRVSDPLSLSCWRTIPHYNLVIIIELSVVNVGNLTTTLLYEIWNFFESFGTTLLFAKFVQHFFVIFYHPRLPKQKSCAIYLQKVWFKHFRD